MHVSVITFFTDHLHPEDVYKKRVLEVGSRNYNGSIRPLVESMCPGSYIGTDLQCGDGVDMTVPATELVTVFGENAFDIVLCVETLEHVLDWGLAVENMKRVCAPGGLVFVTTRSKGFPYHQHPDDFWRFELDDFFVIFGDLWIDNLLPDLQLDHPGVFLRARKSHECEIEPHRTKIPLYSIKQGRRI